MSKIVCILQARTNSTRLPAKVLLPVAGIPLIVLAAKRAANTGLEVVVATSNQASDDMLASTLKLANVNVVRGSLDNTLKRFVLATEQYTDQTIIVRLTGDNVFPDGQFIDELVDYYLQYSLDYVGTTGVGSGLPYGVSAEVFKLHHLREAYHKVKDDYSKEHVTPFIYATYENHLYKKYRELNMESLSCTVDTLDDYLKIAALFEDVSSPIDISWLELSERLNKQAQAHKASKIMLGGAQLGLDYGINNQSGMMSVDELNLFLNTAYEMGIKCIDSAQAYGESEQRIGQCIRLIDKPFSINTKLTPNLLPLTDINKQPLIEQVKESLAESVYNLKENLSSLMLHRLEHAYLDDGVVWQYLVNLKEQKEVLQIGISVQTPEELERALTLPQVDIIQMPFNVLDHRWDVAINKTIELKKQSAISIHVRSVFLQGLLVSSDLMHWQKAHLNQQEALDVLTWLDKMAQHCHCDSKQQLCLAYVNAQPWVDKIVLGIDSLPQLLNNLETFHQIKLSKIQLNEISKNKPMLDDKTLNPALWES